MTAFGARPCAPTLTLNESYTAYYIPKGQAVGNLGLTMSQNCHNRFGSVQCLTPA